MSLNAYPAGVYSGRAGSIRVPVRFVARMVLIVLIMVGLLLVMVIPGTDADRGPVEAASHVVQAGDSLWSIAIIYTPEAGDVRQTMALIRDTNRLPSGVLPVGDSIKVPVGALGG